MDISPGHSGALGATTLRFAIGDCFRDHRPASGGTWPRLDTIQDRLWREEPATVATAYDAVILGSVDGMLQPKSATHGLLASRMRSLRRPMPRRDKRGWTLDAIARNAGMDREVLARLMEHHGYLELAYCGGVQRRRLVTDAAYRADLGHNVDPTTRSRRLDGIGRAVPFPVFYPDRVHCILWTLEWPGIQAKAGAISSKRERMRWLLREHAYLPDHALAELGGYSLRGVKKARATLRETAGRVA